MSTHAYVINTRTGTRTPYRVVWSAHLDTCTRCDQPMPDDRQDDDICDDCLEIAAIDDWLNRSHEAQDRAVLRGMG